MKVAELTGARLALWVARAAGHKDAFLWTERSGRVVVCKNAASTEGFMPHEDWRDAGPLIERLHISVRHIPQRTYGHADTDDGWMGPHWAAFIQNHPKAEAFSDEEQPLRAAMRVVVSSVYGDEVPDEG